VFGHFQIWLFLEVFGCFVLSIAATMVHNRARARNLETAAQALGLAFTPWIGPDSAPNISTPYLMKDTHAYKNVITGGYAGLDIKVFDYARTSGSVSNSSTTVQTVAVYTKNVSLPSFALGPGGLAAKIIDALEHQNVEISSDREFARRYSVRGPDKEKVRALFSDGLISFFKGLDHNKAWQIEGSGNALVIYRFAWRIKPSDLKNFLDETSSIAQSFFAYAGAGHTNAFSAGHSL
jgi:hypothetical protein